MKYIIHISDIHIRNGDKIKSRYDEYINVFDNLIEQINDLNINDNNNFIILVTGDIFDGKNKVESCGIMLFNYLFDKLVKLAKVYIIQGNHDFRQDQPDTPDILTSLSRKDITYWDKTGTYIVDGITFAVVSIKDVLIEGATSGIREKLPQFPKGDIAVFHGLVERFPNNWFDDHKLCLLGDNHKQKIWKKNGIIYGYPGSLIQQTYGEDIIGHGFILWDLFAPLDNKSSNDKSLDNKSLDNKSSNDQIKNESSDKSLDKSQFNIKGVAYHVNNDCGLLNIKDNKIVNYFNNNKVTIEEIIQSGDYPKNSKQKISFQPITTSFDNLCYDYIIKEINNTDPLIKKIFEDPSILRFPENTQINNDKSILEKIAKVNKEILERSDKYKNDIKRVNKFTLVSINWSWILCYGANNSFNFEKIKKKICVIGGKNDYGKSSFFEIICLGIFGQSNPSRVDNESIICTHKPKGESAKISVTFITGNDQYKLDRVFRLTKDKFHMVPKLFKNGNIFKEGSKAIKEWIKDNIGTLESFLLLNMLTQESDCNFFNYQNNKQMEILDKSLKLDAINDLEHIITLSYKIHDKILKSLVAKIITLQPVAKLDDNILISYDEKIKEYENKKFEILMSENDINDYISKELELRKSETFIKKNVDVSTNVLTDVSTEVSQLIPYNQWKQLSLEDKLKYDVIIDENVRAFIFILNEKIAKCNFQPIKSSTQIKKCPKVDKPDKMIKPVFYIPLSQLSDEELEKKLKKIDVNPIDMKYTEAKIYLEKYKNRPFNPSCEACKKQIWVKKRDKYSQDIKNGGKNTNNYYKGWDNNYDDISVDKYIEIYKWRKYCDNQNAYVLYKKYKENKMCLMTQLRDKLASYLDISKIDEAIKYKNILNDKKENDKIINKLRNEYYSEKNKIEKNKIDIDNYNKQQEYNKSMELCINDIKSKRDILEKIKNSLSGYRKYLYKNQVIPKLINDTNKIVATIIPNDSTTTETTSTQSALNNQSINLNELTGIYNDKYNIIDWYINGITINKSGGFRKFLFGIALRIALTCVEMMCTQFFIDEGFVSADSDNLFYMPEFIKEIIKIYDSVILVSHLDVIKDSGDEKIIIKKNKNVSELVL